MSEENISLEFRLKNIDGTRNYLIEEINRNELMSKKHKNVFSTPNLFSILPYFSVNNYCMYFHFCFCFVSWYSNKNYEFCSWIKNFCNNYRNKNV